MTASTVVEEEVLAELERLYEKHVLDEAALPTGILTHDDDWLLSRQQQFHHIVVSDRIVCRNHNVLN